MRFWKTLVSLSLLAATVCAEGKSLILRNGVDGYQGAEDSFIKESFFIKQNQLDSAWILDKASLESN